MEETNALVPIPKQNLATHNHVSQLQGSAARMEGAVQITHLMMGLPAYVIQMLTIRVALQVVIADPVLTTANVLDAKIIHNAQMGTVSRKVMFLVIPFHTLPVSQMWINVLPFATMTPAAILLSTPGLLNIAT